MIDPAFLLCLMNYISRLTVSQQEWRLWIMLLHVCLYKFRIRIRIAILTQMSAGIICSDIRSEQACTFSVTLIFITLRNLKPCMKCGLKSFLPVRMTGSVAEPATRPLLS